MWDIRITRVFDAPREAVYRAVTDLDHRPEAMRLCAQNGSEHTDASPGPAGPAFDDVRENELLSGTTGDMRLRLEFHDEPGARTRLVLTQGPCPAELEGPAREGWSATFAQLDKRLARSGRTGSAGS